jgi:hypothetical protein
LSSDKAQITNVPDKTENPNGRFPRRYWVALAIAILLGMAATILPMGDRESSNDYPASSDLDSEGRDLDRPSPDVKAGLLSEDELSLMRERAVDGPFRVIGDFSPNSPGHWTEMWALIMTCAAWRTT